MSLVPFRLIGLMLPPLVLTDSARFYSRNLNGTAFNPADEPTQVSGNCDQQDRGEREKDVEDARRSLWKSPLAKTPATEKPNHSARGQGKDQVQKQVSLQPRAFQLPLPCGQSGRDRNWRGQG